MNGEETAGKPPRKKIKHRKAKRRAKRRYASARVSVRRPDGTEGLKALRAKAISTAIAYLEKGMPDDAPIVVGRVDDYKAVAILGALASLRRIAL